MATLINLPVGRLRWGRRRKEHALFTWPFGIEARKLIANTGAAPSPGTELAVELIGRSVRLIDLVWLKRTRFKTDAHWPRLEK